MFIWYTITLYTIPPARLRSKNKGMEIINLEINIAQLSKLNFNGIIFKKIHLLRQFGNDAIQAAPSWIGETNLNDISRCYTCIY